MKSKLAIWSFVLSIIPLFLYLFGHLILNLLDFSIIRYFLLFNSFLFSPTSLVLGILALRKISKNPSLKGKTLAILGIILGVLGSGMALMIGFGMGQM